MVIPDLCSFEVIRGASSPEATPRQLGNDVREVICAETLLKISTASIWSCASKRELWAGY